MMSEIVTIKSANGVWDQKPRARQTPDWVGVDRLMSRKLYSISRVDLPNRHSSMAERGWNCADWCISLPPLCLTAS